MPRFDGTLALKLDFGSTTTTTAPVAPHRGGNRLRLAGPNGPDRYKVLEHRRRQAQIKARHLLDQMEEN